MDLFRGIAPELYLKRLDGRRLRPRTNQSNFRNEGLGWRWNPEFTMLEGFIRRTRITSGIMNTTQGRHRAGPFTT